ncbi:hypothetical protein N7467_011728 [Penicillium canescens]|nr:hypothetical protein N7467_011728 [Penicillium canescens]
MRPTTLITIIFASLALAAPHGEAADSHKDMARATREEATPWSVPADSPPPSTPPVSSPPAEASSPPAKSPPPEASPSEDSQHYDHVMMSHNNGHSEISAAQTTIVVKMTASLVGVLGLDPYLCKFQQPVEIYGE